MSIDEVKLYAFPTLAPEKEHSAIGKESLWKLVLDAGWHLHMGTVRSRTAQNA